MRNVFAVPLIEDWTGTEISGLQRWLTYWSGAAVGTWRLPRPWYGESLIGKVPEY